MLDVTAELLDRIVWTIVDEVDPEQVVLFGSRARGDARPTPTSTSSSSSPSRSAPGGAGAPRPSGSTGALAAISLPTTCWSRAVTRSSGGGLARAASPPRGEREVDRRTAAGKVSPGVRACPRAFARATTPDRISIRPSSSPGWRTATCRCSRWLRTRTTPRTRASDSRPASSGEVPQGLDRVARGGESVDARAGRAD